MINRTANTLSRVLTAALVMVGPSLFGADVETAIGQYNEKNYDAAQSTLNEVLAEKPDDATAHLYLGRVLIANGKYADAQPHLRKAIEAEKPEAQVDLGKSFMYLEKYGDATSNFDSAAQTQQENPDLFLSYGMTLLKQNKPAEAAAKLDTALKLDPNNGYAHYYMGVAQNSLKRPDLMLEHFRKFLELEPDAPEAARVRALLRTR